MAVVSNSYASSFPLQGGSALRLDFSALLGPLFFTCEWGWLNAFCTCQALVALCPRLRSFDRPLHATLHSATRLCLSVGPAVLSHCSRLPVAPSFRPPAGLLQLLLPLMLFNLVYEKERRLRTIMKMHGLGDVAYWTIQVRRGSSSGRHCSRQHQPCRLCVALLHAMPVGSNFS